MMIAVVQRGTGTAAALPDVQVAGKTGTATNPAGRSHAWFVAFAPADAPRVALAIVVENAGYGGGVVAAGRSRRRGCRGCSGLGRSPSRTHRAGPHRRMTDRTLKERYRLDNKLGEGGMATVYAGTDALLRRRVAIKVLRPQFSADAEFVKRFYHEAESVARLSYPNIVSIFDDQNGRIG